ncbi:MAG: HAD-IB family hydrolase [Dermatophilaceae bacterium]
MDTEDVLTQIRNGPRGPRIGAFFDFDGTLIDGYSASTLYEHRLRARQVGPLEAIRAIKAARGGPMSEAEFESFVGQGISGWKGKPEGYLQELGKKLYTGGIASHLFHEAWRLVKAHQRAGHTVVIASSATRVQIAGVAKALGVTDVLCTELEVVGGTLTGKLAGRTLWGEGKEAGIRDFARRKRLSLAKAYGYANGDEDIPFLETVGHPYAVNPQPQLAKAASVHGWPVLAFQQGNGRFDLAPVLRTGGIWASLIGGGAAGIAMSLLSGDKRRGINFMINAFAQFGGAFGDIKVEVVQGQGHLWSDRPAVFLINHQSALIDLLVGATVLREDVTALAKKEIKQMPVVGPMMGYAQFAFVDRADSTQAREALKEALDLIERGVSVVVAPEGTRSYTPEVGAFKKGAFYLAREAQVPVIPIVVRNSGQIMWRDNKTARPGRIEVAVKEPFRVEGTGQQPIDRATALMHRLYVDSLESWPGPTAAGEGS